MAPIKYENDFKEKLEKRTIAPSERAWETLTERLDAEEKASSNKGFWWIGIAASAIGILFIATQFFSNDKDTHIPEVVNTEEAVETPMDTSVKKDVIVTRVETTIAKEDADNQSNKEGLSLIINKAKNYQDEPSKRIAEEPIIQNIKKEKDLEQSEAVEIISFENRKAQEVADAIHALSEKKSGVSDASIDSLLKAAQRDILLSRMQNEDQVAIDAALLLQEVEFELDESFRDKVFKAFKSSYGSIKTAVAQRND
ncbi:hypothetical protein EYD45_11175 [Hyunsoonleella flava]|uniref:Uncharacterized protein n=1 Tax=Hyunsoonleella flava TaxID=2527939 RepID=A0A4V2JA48_9FLAO|nr:hypothetical protein [Hyunsoonleella flava]TBN02683.1 hypothetical protein EYD45_11175 [Hyunsoonleella flava]